MAGIYGIDVPFENRHYTALVSLKEEEGNICCMGRYIDKGVRHILSGDRLLFSVQED